LFENLPLFDLRRTGKANPVLTSGEALEENAIGLRSAFNAIDNLFYLATLDGGYRGCSEHFEAYWWAPYKDIAISIEL
jgi:hypothetical protein